MKVKISTLSLENSTRHLTGAIKIIISKLKNMTHRRVLPASSKNPFSRLQRQTGPATLIRSNNYRRVLPALVLPHLRTAQLGVPLQGRHPSVVITTILATVIAVSAVSVVLSNNTSALTYQDSVDVSFTFDPTLSISLSSNNISIDNLVPGNFAHSNTITINVSTNNVYGYTLTAKVGEDGGGTGTSASSDLVNASSSTPFTSLSSNDRLTLANFNPNTWGYTTSSSINNNSTTYSGLLYNTDTVLNITTGNAGKSIAGYPGTNTTNFTIGASASTDQLSGNYTNMISFTAVTNVVNTFTIDKLKYMQDFANLTIDEKAEVLDSMTEDEAYVLHDSRDEQEYTVAKLADGKVWMTKNLNLAGGAILSSDKSDVPSINYYALPLSTVATSGTSISSDQFSNDADSYVFNSGSINCSSKSSCYSYYSWMAATAGGKDIHGDMVSFNGYNADYSICPLGWRLPVCTTSNQNAQINFNWKTGDGYGLAVSYGAVLENNYLQNKSVFYEHAGPGTIPDFLLAGRYDSGSFQYGSQFGVYWSATSSSNNYAYSISLSPTYVNSAYSDYRRYGRSVRCILR